jgi:hypothetical protein
MIYVTLPYDKSMRLQGNMDNHLDIMRRCGIICDYLNYLGGGSYTGCLWSIKKEYVKSVPLLLLATGGTIFTSDKENEH